MTPHIHKCGGVHNLKTLSFFTAGTSGILSTTTVTLNFIILYLLGKNQNGAFKPLFFRAIFNIALADLFTGLIVDTLSINFVVKEGMQIPLTEIEVEASHLSVFIFSSVSVVTMGLLSVERLWALIRPFDTLKGVKTWKVGLAVAATWIVSILLSLTYLKVGFVQSLAVFACTTVVLSFVLMIVTSAVYYQRLGKNHDRRKGAYTVARSSEKGPSSRNSQTELKKSFVQGERRVTKTFIIMLLVFLVSYLPTGIMVIYMNSCAHCNCTLIHSMRDLTFLCMVSGALFRPINFICRLKILRRAVKNIICRTAGRPEDDRSFTDMSLRRAKPQNV